MRDERVPEIDKASQKGSVKTLFLTMLPSPRVRLGDHGINPGDATHPCCEKLWHFGGYAKDVAGTSSNIHSDGLKVAVDMGVVDDNRTASSCFQNWQTTMRRPSEPKSCLSIVRSVSSPRNAMVIALIFVFVILALDFGLCRIGTWTMTVSLPTYCSCREDSRSSGFLGSAPFSEKFSGFTDNWLPEGHASQQTDAASVYASSEDAVLPEEAAQPVQASAEEPAPDIDPCLASLPEAKLLPCGMRQSTTDLRMQHLWKDPDPKAVISDPNLLAMAVGIKQKKLVNAIVCKFLAVKFTVMLFHYDGVVDEWMQFPWSQNAIHIVALRQTKWWFAKRFMHPSVISIYNYIFLWDEDLGVQNFEASRYLEIIREEGLDISQPALGGNSTEIHHDITRRWSGHRVHRTARSSYLRCEGKEGPPCTGWVELMAPVFNKNTWNCIWSLIQNDLIHGWGLDFSFGYCVQGNRTEKVGVVDEQYVTHLGVISLTDTNKEGNDLTNGNSMRGLIRRKSSIDLRTFLLRWLAASKDDKYWRDPYFGSQDKLHEGR